VVLRRSLLRFEQEGFVGLDDACELLRPVVFDPVKKTVAPAKRRIAVDANVLGGATHRARIEQLCQVIEPLSFEPEPRQRRAGQVIEGASALTATEPLQVIGLAMAVAAFAGAIRATASRCANLGNERDHAVEPGCRMEGGQHLQPLGLVQRRQLREQLHETGRLHDPLPLTTTGVGPRTSSAVQYSSISNVDSAMKNGACAPFLHSAVAIAFSISARVYPWANRSMKWKAYARRYEPRRTA